MMQLITTEENDVVLIMFTNATRDFLEVTITFLKEQNSYERNDDVKRDTSQFRTLY